MSSVTARPAIQCGRPPPPPHRAAVLQVAVGGPGPLALAQGTGAKTCSKTCTYRLRMPESLGTLEVPPYCCTAALLHARCVHCAASVSHVRGQCGELAVCRRAGAAEPECNYLPPNYAGMHVIICAMR